MDTCNNVVSGGKNGELATMDGFAGEEGHEESSPNKVPGEIESSCRLCVRFHGIGGAFIGVHIVIKVKFGNKVIVRRGVHLC